GCWQPPAVFARPLLGLRTRRRYRLEIGGLHRLPARGPVLLVTDAPTGEACLRVLSATDRLTRFLLVFGLTEPRLGGLTRALVKWHELALVDPGDSVGVEEVVRRAKQALARGVVVGLSLEGAGAEEASRALAELA